MPLLNLYNNLTSLVKLNVSKVKELTCFPEEMLHNNISLQLPQSLYNLHSLRILKISLFPNFHTFSIFDGEKYLTSLKSLGFTKCNRLTNLPSRILQHYRSLEYLTVNNCKNLVSYPLHFGEMPSLSQLDMLECPKLISVHTGGLHCLTGLRKLEIGPFSKMVDFEAFQLIFNGIQQLLSLYKLRVHGRANWESLPH